VFFKKLCINYRTPSTIVDILFNIKFQRSLSHTIEYLVRRDDKHKKHFPWYDELLFFFFLSIEPVRIFEEINSQRLVKYSREIGIIILCGCNQNVLKKKKFLIMRLCNRQMYAEIELLHINPEDLLFFHLLLLLFIYIYS
jgi:hypothetical protein